MKKTALVLAMLLPFVAGAQTKIKETAVPRSVILSLEKTYDAYKVRTWYQAPGQYIAEVVIDGQDGRAYFTAGGDWQYSAFPVKMEECPTLMTAYFTDNYPGYRSKSIDYVEEMNGDNYYRMIITKKGISDKDFEMVFDTRGKLMKSNAPDPEAVKRDFYTLNNPDATDDELNKATKTSSSRHANRPKPRKDEPMVEQFTPCDAALADFEKSIGQKRCKSGPDWVNRNDQYAVAYFTDKQKVEKEAVYDIHTGKPIMVGKVLAKDRYNNGIMKYLAEKFNGEKYKIEKMVVYEYNSKFRGADGKKPKPYTYVVVSQRIKNSRDNKFIRMEFDSKGQFTNLLAQPLDEKDVQ
ncbi:MAG: hypothetical protein J6I49_06410 [Bacteroidales bacterium]|nr:hypothetical protein [Bacteroidales bacterium]